MNMSVVTIIFVGLFLLLVLSSTNPYIKGGSASTKCKRWGVFNASETLMHGDNIIDTSGLKRFIVNGNSMSRYGIKDKMAVYIEKYHEITDYPIIAFSIKSGYFDAQYKLRKFVQYIDDTLNVDWSDIYENNKDYMRIPKEAFITEMKNRVDVLKRNGDVDGRFILSYTHKEKENQDHYSLHNEKNAIGIVKYYA